MKKLSEFVSTTADSDIKSPENSDAINNQSTPEYPEYMITDSGFIGYESTQQQYTVYRSAAYGTIVTGIETVLDVGCGRGDFGDYLLARHPNVNYTGFDLNPLMVEVGLHKHSQSYSTFRYNLYEVVFDNTLETAQSYDYVYNLNNMSLDYGLFPDIYVDNNRYTYLKMMIQKSLDVCNIGVVFMLHNESIDVNETPNLLTYSLSHVSNILYDMNLKFAIDNTDIPDMYKLVILKKPF